MSFYSKCWILENNVALELNCIQFPEYFVLWQGISIINYRCYKREQTAVDNHLLGCVAVQNTRHLLTLWTHLSSPSSGTKAARSSKTYGPFLTYYIMSQPRPQMSSNDEHMNIASCTDKMLFQCNLRLSGSTNCI